MVLAANLFMSPRDNRNARLLAVGLSSGAGFTWKTLTSCSRPSMVILKGGSSKSWPGHFLWAWKCYGDLHREHDDKPWHGMRLTIFSDKAAEVSFSGWNHLFWRKKKSKIPCHTQDLPSRDCENTQSHLRFMAQMMTLIFATPKGTFPPSSAFPLLEHN